MFSWKTPAITARLCVDGFFIAGAVAVFASTSFNPTTIDIHLILFLVFIIIKNYFTSSNCMRFQNYVEVITIDIIPYSQQMHIYYDCYDSQ